MSAAEVDSERENVEVEGNNSCEQAYGHHVQQILEHSHTNQKSSVAHTGVLNCALLPRVNASVKEEAAVVVDKKRTASDGSETAAAGHVDRL